MGPREQEARIAELESEVHVLHAMLRSAPDFVSRITLDGKFLYMNHVVSSLRFEDVLGASIDDYIPEGFHERAWAAIRAAIETRTVQQYKTIGPGADGELGHYLTRVAPVVEHGEVTSLVMIAADVTALEEQRLRLQVALDAGGVGIWTHKPNENRGVWDAQSLRIFGFDNDEPPTVHEFIEKCVHPDDREHTTRAFAQLASAGRFGPVQYRYLRRGGEVRWVSASGLAVRDHEGRTAQVVGSVQDITDRRLLEERLLEAQKLESIGRLAGGVAHDFNNMLTAIFGNVEFAERAQSVEEVRPLLESIRVAAERSAALTAQLLAFARRQVIEPRVLEPNDLVRRFETVFQRAIGERIRIVLSLAAEGRVRADQSQLEQVVMNLVTNARDAMPDGGALTIETLDVALDQRYADSHPEVRPGPYVLLAVSDTGVGIAKEALPHVFEPFFTTRTGGTGLGLATCYGIVKQSGGHLSVYSEPGRGATFKVYLPRVDGEPRTDQQRVGARVVGRAGRVLVVEDEDPVRSVIERTLRAQHHHVVSVTTAEEALRLAESEPGFELLVTDVVLPGIGGRALSEQLEKRMPELRVLFISGYTENAIVHGGVLDAGIHFLQKPFLPTKLAAMVQSLLDGRRTATGE